MYVGSRGRVGVFHRTCVTLGLESKDLDSRPTHLIPKSHNISETSVSSPIQDNSKPIYRAGLSGGLNQIVHYLTGKQLIYSL